MTGSSSVQWKQRHGPNPTAAIIAILVAAATPQLTHRISLWPVLGPQAKIASLNRSHKYVLAIAAFLAIGGLAKEATAQADNQRSDIGGQALTAGKKAPQFLGPTRSINAKSDVRQE